MSSVYALGRAHSIANDSDLGTPGKYSLLFSAPEAIFFFFFFVTAAILSGHSHDSVDRSLLANDSDLGTPGKYRLLLSAPEVIFFFFF